MDQINIHAKNKTKIEYYRGGWKKFQLSNYIMHFNIGRNGARAELRYGSTLTMKTRTQEVEARTTRYENCIIQARIKTHTMYKFFFRI